MAGGPSQAWKVACRWYTQHAGKGSGSGYTSSCSYIMMYYTNRYRWVAISAVLTVHTVSCTHHNGALLLDMGQL